MNKNSESLFHAQWALQLCSSSKLLQSIQWLLTIKTYLAEFLLGAIYLMDNS